MHVAPEVPPESLAAFAPPRILSQSTKAVGGVHVCCYNRSTVKLSKQQSYSQLGIDITSGLGACHPAADNVNQPISVTPVAMKLQKLMPAILLQVIH
jgi:hypothetical protein